MKKMFVKDDFMKSREKTSLTNIEMNFAETHNCSLILGLAIVSRF